MNRRPHSTCPPFWKRLIRALLLVVVLVGARPHAIRAQPAGSTEYQVKAAFLLNFLQFIQWPASAFADASTSISVGILGDDPFGQDLEKTFDGESIQNRRIVVKRSRRIEDLNACHLIFVSKSEGDRVPGIITSLNDRAVVTVGETDGFARIGGIINFFMDGKRVRFEINADAAQRKGIKIHSQLLARARIIGAPPGRAGA
jgi:hypothetical protein